MRRELPRPAAVLLGWAVRTVRPILLTVVVAAAGRGGIDPGHAWAETPAEQAWVQPTEPGQTPPGIDPGLDPESSARRAASLERFLDAADRLYPRWFAGRSCSGRPFELTVLSPYDERGAFVGSIGGAVAPSRNGDGSERSPVLADWSPYTGTFGLAQSAHLHRRAMIGPKIAEMRAGVASGLNTTVAGLLAARPLPPPPDTWATEPLPDLSNWTQQQIDSLVTVYLTRQELLRYWWTERILDPNPGVTEAMTLFWHDHFACGSDKIFIPAAVYKQNQLFRQYATGNFKDLVQAICLDPAMLIFLDGQYNVAGDVNENFARELLELFTMGVGHYSQDDVREAARAFTGYTTYDGWGSVFEPWNHDYGSKTFLGHTGPYFGHDIVTIIFQQPETARFICRKLYRYFIDEVPDEARIEELAVTLRNSNYEIKPVLEKMWKSQLFYDPGVRGSIYCDAVDRWPALWRTFNVPGVNFDDYGGTLYNWTAWGSYITGQVLMQPPNVAGWPGYRSWLNSYVLPWRRILSTSVVDGEIFGEPYGFGVDVIAFANSLPNPNNANALIDDLATCLYGATPTPLVRTALLNALLQGMSPGSWSMSFPGAEGRLRNLLRTAVKMADFQLK